MDNQKFNGKVRIGYQGCPGSFAEKAANMYVHTRNIENYSIKPLFSAQGVAGALLRREIDAGVVAFKHDHAGYDIDTSATFKRFNRTKLFCEIGEYVLAVSYNLYGYKPTMPYRVEKIMGAHDAIKLSRNTLNKLCGKVQYLSVSDVSISAKYIGQGLYGEKLALICNADTAAQYNLVPLVNNILDYDENRTIFKVIALDDNFLTFKLEQRKAFKTPIVLGASNKMADISKSLDINPDKDDDNRHQNDT